MPRRSASEARAVNRRFDAARRGRSRRAAPTLRMHAPGLHVADCGKGDIDDEDLLDVSSVGSRASRSTRLAQRIPRRQGSRSCPHVPAANAARATRRGSTRSHAPSTGRTPQRQSSLSPSCIGSCGLSFATSGSCPCLRRPRCGERLAWRRVEATIGASRADVTVSGSACFRPDGQADGAGSCSARCAALAVASWVTIKGEELGAWGGGERCR